MHIQIAFCAAVAFAAASLISLGALAQTSAPIPAVLVQAAGQRVLAPQTELIGRVHAIDKVELRARVQGFLGPRRFQEGADVTEGQLLFSIEREPFEATLAQRKAQLAAAQATQQNTGLQLARTRELASRGNAPHAQLDQRVSEDARARAAVLEAEAAVKDAEIQLSYTEILAPISGRIGRVAVSPGNLVGPGTGVLAVLVRHDRMHVLFPVTQRDLLEARRRVGDGQLTVSVKLADGSFAPEVGKIDLLDVQVDPKTDGQIVRAVFDNPKGALTEGQTVRVVVEQQEVKTVVAIPQTAVAADQAGTYVYVVGKDNVVQERRVRLGARREGYIAVQDGVADGDLVIVQGQQRVRPGMTVTPEKAPLPPS